MGRRKSNGAAPAAEEPAGTTGVLDQFRAEAKASADAADAAAQEAYEAASAEAAREAGALPPPAEIDPKAFATLSGDICRQLLRHVENLKKPWPKMSEWDQQGVINDIRMTAESMVRQAVRTIAHRGFSHVIIDVGKLTIDKGLEGKFTAAASVDNIIALNGVRGRGAVLVLCDPSDFIGESKPVLAQPDQPELPMEEAAGEAVAQGEAVSVGEVATGVVAGLAPAPAEAPAYA